MSAGRNLITLFSGVNNLSRSFFQVRSRQPRAAPASQCIDARNARITRMRACESDCLRASSSAARSDSTPNGNEAMHVIATPVRHAATTPDDEVNDIAERRLISRRTSAFARKLRELFRGHRSPRGHRGHARRKHPGIRSTHRRVAPRIDDRHEKTRGVSAAGSWWPMERRSVLVAFQQLGVVIGAEQFVELVGIGQLHHEQPAVAVGILVDGFRLVGQRGVDLDHLAADRRIHV